MKLAPRFKLAKGVANVVSSIAHWQFYDNYFDSYMRFLGKGPNGDNVLCDLNAHLPIHPPPLPKMTGASLLRDLMDLSQLLAQLSQVSQRMA